MAAENGPSAGEYIVHHLTHLQNTKAKAVVDFSVFNLDSVFFSVLMGVLMCWALWAAARKATLVMPDTMTQERRALLNALDLLPVDLIPFIWERIYGAAGGDPHHAYMRIVPTADLSVSMGLSVSVLVVCLVYNVKIKGVGGWIHELFTAPFGSHPLLWPFNFAMQIIEFVSKTVSHGMRLFGNMYAGELVFLLIALMGGAWAFTATGIALAIGHIIAGTAWAIFHILIITLQAFVFMMLTLVYIGQAHDAH